MARVKGGFTTRRRRKKTLKLAKGYFGSKHALYKTAHEQVMHSLKYAYRDRRQLKREMRSRECMLLSAEDLRKEIFVNFGLHVSTLLAE